jgi:DNA-binding SARP family transcriptional activator
MMRRTEGEWDQVQATSGQEPPPVLPPAVQVFVLGGFKVVVRGQVLPEPAWRRKTARQLFKILLSRPNRRATRDEVVELLWPESDPEAASSNFRSTMFALRNALEVSPAPSGVAVVFSDRDSIWLRSDVELWVDADTFEHTLEQAWRSADPLPLLEQASSLYDGHFLPEDLYEDWATERRDALKQQWAELQIRLSHELERRGDPDAAARPLQHLLQVDPCDERAAQEAMQLLNRYGRRPEALRIYQRLVQALKEELDVEPSGATNALHRQVTAGESAAGRSIPIAAFRCAYPFPSPTELIGREPELAALSRVLASGRGAGQAALVGAPAGTGKSALLGQIVRQAQAQGVLCLAGGCYEEQGAVPMGPFHDALVDYLLSQPVDRVRAELGNSVVDLARVIPELRYLLDLTEEPTRESPKVDRMRVFGAIHAYLRGLAERGPTLLCLEDLHAADEATLQLFHYLVRQTRRLPLVLIGTYRSDEAPPDQPLAQMLAQVTRERLAQQVRLSPLDRDGTTRLTTSLLDGSASEPLAESLFATTGGNPLFLEQLVLALAEGGLLQQRAGVWYGTGEIQGAPQIVREVIAQRLIRLPPSCRETLAMASVLGQTVEHGVLLAARGPIDEQVLLGDLDRAIDASILQDMPGGYAFRHVLLRDAVYWSQSGPRRMLMHLRAAELLEQRYGSRADDHVAELAYHFTLAGESVPIQRKALQYSMQAGRRAAELSSYPESHTHFSRAWDIIERNADLANPSTRLEALEGRGWAEKELAHWTDTASTFVQALDLSDDPVHRARARGLIAFAQSHIGDMPRVLDECAAGLAELKGITAPEAITARLILQQHIAVVWYLQGRYRDIVELGQTMTSEALALGQPRALEMAYRVKGWGHMGQGQVDQAIEQCELAAAASERAGQKVSLAISLTNLGFQSYLGGRFSAALDHLTHAVALYRDSANELRTVNARQHLCRVWVARGELDVARQQVVHAVELEIAGQERWVADGYHILGEIETLSADWDAAAAQFDQALSIRTHVGDMAGIVESTVARALVDQYAGRWSRAGEGLATAVKIADEIDPAPPGVLAHRQFGRLLLLLGDRPRAGIELERAHVLAETMQQTLEYSPTLLAMAELCAYDADHDRALHFAEAALESARPVEQIVYAHTRLASLHAVLGHSVAAAAQASTAVEHTERIGAPRLLSLAHLAVARCASVTNARQADASFQAALRFAELARAPYERAAALEAYAEYLEVAGVDLERAAAMTAEALQIFAQLGLPSAEAWSSVEPGSAATPVGRRTTLH